MPKRLSINKGMYLITLTFLVCSFLGKAQLTATDHNGANNFNTDNPTVTPCGTNAYKVTFYQDNQWQQGRINIKWNGTLIGHTSANGHLAYSTNQQTANNNGGAWAMAGHAGRWWYVLVNTSDETAFGYTTDFACDAAPTVTTDAASVINCSSATSGGNVTDEGTATVTDRGVCWSTSSSPTTADSKTSDGTGTGTFTSSITGLSSGQTYYVRAYATNSVGTSYGSEVSFVADLTVASSSGGTRLGTGTVGLSATTSSGAGNINWYVAASGGTALSPTSSSGATWTTPSISTTTTFYAEADDGSCTSPTRTAVTATVLDKGYPGGVNSNIHLWLKADAETFSDAGSTGSTDGTEVQEWHDQSGNNFDADDSGGNGPDWDADGINFNPTLDFTGGASGEPLDIPNGIMEGGTKTDMYVYSVATIDLTQNQTLFYQDLHTGTSNQVFSFIPHFSNSSSYWDNGHTTSGRVGPVTSGVTLGQPHLFSLKSTTNSMEIKRDNNSIGSNSDNGSSTENNTQPFYIGYQWNNSGNYFDGKLSELIIYDGVPTSTEEDQIESYLAVKYGITLASMDYLSSDGTVIWDNSSYASYHYDIAGIGRDDIQDLNQKQSKSINSDAIVTMSTEAIGTTNAGVSTTLNDGTYLLWGNNNASSDNHSDVPTGYTKRLYREWVVEMTGTVSDVHIEFDISSHLYLSGNSASDFYLLIDGDGDFTSGVASETAASSISGNKVTFDNVNFTDGQFFTLASKTTGPGGVSDHLRLWLKADGGTNTTTDGADVTAWADQSLNAYDADDVGSNPPSFKTNGINFNPALDFSGSEDLRIEDGITTNTSSPQYFFYVVSKRETNGTKNTIFRQNLGTSPARYLIFRHTTDAGKDADFFYGSNSSSGGRHFGTWDNSAVKPHLWSFGSSRDSDNTPNNTHQYIQVDNTTIDHDNNTSNVTSKSTSDFFIGASNTGTNDYDGLIAEIICLDDIPTDEEDLRIKSYLALKYGISLGATTDLKNSAGTVIWDKDYGDGTYTNDISGIGRDDLSGFNQRQSKSINSDDILTMSTQAIAASNAANTTQLGTDASFEMWANNGGSVAVQTSELSASFSHRLTREWLVQETGTVGDVTIEVDLTGLTFANTDANKFALVIDDDGDFSGGTQTTEMANSLSSDKLTFNSVDLSNGKYITVMNGATVLPVELIYFEGKRVGSYVLLEWETMAEVNNDYFIVEKSTDGENWEEILTVDGQGNTSEQTYYSQIDIDGCEDVCYYRLKQFDFDGQSEESKIIVLESENKTQEFKISVSPNPVNQMANIAFTAPEGGMFSLTVTTQTGQVMYTAKTIGDKGNNHISYNASMLSSGSYYFILEDENGNRTQQLVIK